MAKTLAGFFFKLPWEIFWKKFLFGEKFSIPSTDVECGCKKNYIERQKVCFENRLADQLESVKIKRMQIDKI